MTDEIIELAVQTPVVAVGYNIATITVTDVVPNRYSCMWGTATGVYTNILPRTKPKRVYNQDGTMNWVTTFTLTNVQQAAAQAYFAVVVLNGVLSSEITWTQPALNPNAADQVHVMYKVLMAVGNIADICARAATRGWMNGDEWNGLHRDIALVQQYNQIAWNDGR